MIIIFLSNNIIKTEKNKPIYVTVIYNIQDLKRKEVTMVCEEHRRGDICVWYPKTKCPDRPCKMPRKDMKNFDKEMRKKYDN